MQCVCMSVTQQTQRYTSVWIFVVDTVGMFVQAARTYDHMVTVMIDARKKNVHQSVTARKECLLKAYSDIYCASVLFSCGARLLLQQFCLNSVAADVLDQHHGSVYCVVQCSFGLVLQIPSQGPGLHNYIHSFSVFVLCNVMSHRPV